jgi:hypothetical protein
VAGRRWGFRVGCLAVLVLLAGLLVVADRVAAAYAERVAADRLERALPARVVAVDVDGFPFVTQALRRRFGRVDVRADSLGAGRLRISSVDATLLGLRPARDLRTARVDQVVAEGLLTYAAVEEAVDRRGVTVAYGGGDRVAVRGELDILGQEVGVTAICRVSVTGGNAVAVRAERLETGFDILDSVLRRLVGTRLDLDVPVDGLPPGLRLDRLAPGRGGIRAFFSGSDVQVDLRGAS